MPRQAPVALVESRTRAIVTRLVAGIVLLAGAFFVLTITNVCVIRCHSIVPGNPYECSIESSMGGFIASSEVKIENARTVDSEEKGGNTGRVLISNDQTNIATPWLQAAYPGTKALADKINEQFDFRSVTSFKLYQFEAPPAILGLVMALSGIWLLFTAARKALS